MESETNIKLEYIFYPNKGVDNILFEFSEMDVVDKLGCPESYDIDVYVKDIEEAKRLYYPKMGVMISISKYDSKTEPISIHTEKLIVDGVNIFDLSSEMLNDHLLIFHKKLELDFSCEKSEEAQGLYEKCFFYDNIGLTVWFVDGVLNDVCASRPEEKTKTET